MDAAANKLAIYTQPAVSRHRGAALPSSLGLSLAVFGAIGVLLVTSELPPVIQQIRQTSHRITFKAPPLPVEATVDPVAPELTPETVVAQPVDRPAPDPDPVAETPVVAAAEMAPPPVPPRRVYGVRKVLARSLGSGAGTATTGLVVKHGNVLDGVADTLTAVAADLQGQLAALSTVERAPEPTHQVKPHYSDALIAARAAGVVTAKLLVDQDGSVAQVRVLADIGHDSAALAAAAFQQFRFRPALRDGQPVAVWIVYRMRFEFQE